MTTICPKCIRSMTIIDFPFVYIKSIQIHPYPQYICGKSVTINAEQFKLARDNKLSTVLKSDNKITILLNDEIYQNNGPNYYKYDDVLPRIKKIYDDKMDIFSIIQVGDSISRDVFTKILSGMSIEPAGAPTYNIYITGNEMAISFIELRKNIFKFATVELIGQYA